MSNVTNRRLLAVFAHPDDETFLAGETIARHAAEGWDVRLITLARGEAGRRGPYADFSQQEFGALRETELRAACAALGVLDLQVLGFPDKGVGLHEAEALDAVIEVIARWQPALVLTFGPDGISGHTDHVAVSTIVTAAVERIAVPVSPYPFAAGPNLYCVARSPGVPGGCVSHEAATPPPITTIVDVTEAADGKGRTKGAYRSQMHLQAGASGAPPDGLIAEMFHRALPPWISRTPETVGYCHDVRDGHSVEEACVTTKLEFSVTARRVDASGSLATCKDATLTLDTALAGRRDALNPAELLLAALSACMITGIERVAPMLTCSFRGVAIRVHGVRQDVPPRIERIDYVIAVDPDEPDRRLALLHENVKKYGTVFNTVAPGTVLEGVIRRAS